MGVHGTGPAIKPSAFLHEVGRARNEAQLCRSFTVCGKTPAVAPIWSAAACCCLSPGQVADGEGMVQTLTVSAHPSWLRHALWMIFPVSLHPGLAEVPAEFFRKGR